jgi:cadmium resistance protein CadD (predicted permease)
MAASGVGLVTLSTIGGFTVDVVGTVALAMVVFASTNIDDILVLLMFYADPHIRSRDITIGQYVGVGALILLSLIATAATLAIPESLIRYLGLVPITLGIRALFAWRPSPENAAPLPDPSTGALSRTAAVTAITFANGGDNVGIYTPLFASHDLQDTGIIVAVFLVLIGVWCLVAKALVSHRAIGAAVQRLGQYMLPVVLIGLGLYIFLTH